MMAYRPLGRRPPTDHIHVSKYGLTAETIPDKPTPVIAGTDWWTGFDRPLWDRAGFWYVPDEGLGRNRGGHAYCFQPDAVHDSVDWYRWYDQGQEGACVGFAISRAMSLLNRERYDARWLYKEAQRIDEWAGEDYDGTSVRAGLDVVRERGHRNVYRGVTRPVHAENGIVRNRWATSVEDAIAAMHSPRYLKLGRAPLLNSWGVAYPRRVWMSLDTLGRLLKEGGELAVIYDKP
jgi:hypothetical protein